MPIYEYRCQQCGHELERLQRMSDDPLTDCPSCGEAQLKRLISAAAFRLKGGGWYETDFKKDGKRNLADSGNEAPKSDSKEKDQPKADKKESTGSEKAPTSSKPATESKPA
ncbi:MAG: zinc ribbon domain-containing protein [Xanthomonadales bacterium]|nr:zinc ribbon domain-containing protein [Xanthomonadales bacterium]NNL95145.1 zinc ribbon domain-containing protein [Xanthomonadales bacterium]